MRAAFLAVGLLLVPGMAGCLSPQDQAPDRDLRARWASERDAHGPVGLAATFDVRGSPIHVRVEGTVEAIAAPLEMHPAKATFRTGHYVYVPDADVAGQGRGFLVIEATRVQASEGRLEALEAAELALDSDVAITPATTSGIKPTVAFPEAWADANASFFFSDRVNVRIVGLRLDGYQRAALITSSGSSSLTGPLTVDASALFWFEGSTLRATRADVEAARFSLGGNITAGELSYRDGGTARAVAPTAIIGKGAELRLEAGRARSPQEFRLTQAVVDGELLLRAHVEVQPSDSAVSVVRGEQAWLAVSYREKGYRGDAVLEDIVLSGAGKDLLQVPVKRPPLIIQQLWDVVAEVAEDAPWAAPFFAIPLAAASPAILLLDFFLGVACAFTVCPEQYPYPFWMDAGDVGVFYVKARGDAAPGTYPVTVTLKGQNFDDVQFRLDVIVAPPA
jgi:hypothetical protein